MRYTLTQHSSKDLPRLKNTYESDYGVEYFSDVLVLILKSGKLCFGRFRKVCDNTFFEVHYKEVNISDIDCWYEMEDIYETSNR